MLQVDDRVIVKSFQPFYNTTLSNVAACIKEAYGFDILVELDEEFYKPGNYEAWVLLDNLERLIDNTPLPLPG